MPNRDSFIAEFYKLQNYDPKTIGPLIDKINKYLATNEPDTKLELLSCALKTQKEMMLDNDFIKAWELAKPAVDILQDADWDLFELDIFLIVLMRIESYELALDMIKKAHDVLDRKFPDTEHFLYRKYKIFSSSSARHLRAKFYDNPDPKKVKEMFDTCVDSSVKICEKYNYLKLRNVQLTYRAIFDEDVSKILDCVRAIVATEDKYWIAVIKNKVAEYTRNLGKNVTTKLKNLVVGWQIQKRRKELGIKTAKFAEMIGSTQVLINQIERGDSGVSQRRLYEIAQVLGVDDLAYFLGGPVNRPTDTYVDQIEYMISPLSDKKKKYAVELIRVYVESSGDEK